MAHINSINISPPVLNSSCAWASDFEHLKELYTSHFTGAVTTRTSTLEGFPETEQHMVAFKVSNTSSINSYGYSPYPLAMYLTWIRSLLQTSLTGSHKPFIISITASSPDELSEMVDAIQRLRKELMDAEAVSCRIAIELNTSCPNIPGSAPKGYILSTDVSMRILLNVLSAEVKRDRTLTVGLKLPPYVYRQQFVDVVNLISSYEYVDKDAKSRNPFSFFTCTNTLGNSLLFGSQVGEEIRPFAVPTVLGGLAGDELHALSLGNVYTFSRLLKQDAENKGRRAIAVIGVGGVTSLDARKRMHDAGASAVGCATLLGRHGVQAFETLSE